MQCEQGARALMMIPTIIGARVKISAQKVMSFVIQHVILILIIFKMI